MKVRSPVAIAAGLAASATGAAALAMTTTAHAQTVSTSRPTTLVVGAPPGARTDGIDGARSGLSRTPLPSAALRVEWRASTGASLEHAPLVDARGTTFVVGGRGEVVAIGRNGAEQWRTLTGGLDAGPPALLADDTVVFTDGAGEAVAAQEGGARWRVRFGRSSLEGNVPAPLPLEDGGIILATARELVVLDAEGHERARTTLPDPIATLLTAPKYVVVVSRAGIVWTWVPGAAAPSRVASFGSPIVGGAVRASNQVVLALIASSTTLAALDWTSGTLVARAVATDGTWIGPPAVRGDATTLVMWGTSQETAITFDSAGREVARAFLAAHPGTPRNEASAGPPEPAPIMVPNMGAESATLVDLAGTLIFASNSGAVRTVGASGAGAVETLADVCPRGFGAVAGASPVAGVAPLSASSVVVACRSGSVVAVSASSR